MFQQDLSLSYFKVAVLMLIAMAQNLQCHQTVSMDTGSLFKVETPMT